MRFSLLVFFRSFSFTCVRNPFSFSRSVPMLSCWAVICSSMRTSSTDCSASHGCTRYTFRKSARRQWWDAEYTSIGSAVMLGNFSTGRSGSSLGNPKCSKLAVSSASNFSCSPCRSASRVCVVSCFCFVFSTNNCSFNSIALAEPYTSTLSRDSRPTRSAVYWLSACKLLSSSSISESNSMVMLASRSSRLISSRIIDSCSESNTICCLTAKARYFCTHSATACISAPAPCSLWMRRRMWKSMRVRMANSTAVHSTRCSASRRRTSIMLLLRLTMRRCCCTHQTMLRAFSTRALAASSLRCRIFAAASSRSRSEEVAVRLVRVLSCCLALCCSKKPSRKATNSSTFGANLSYFSRQ
mmetsp:Transcript_6760/g.11285  ORF Transcript_6760/g.11285 Transcript_6760/m.11285 type:complete len:356 (-) Transcript_6760:76-1143(-)